jgi:prolipoprotein diacylglyceryltransferase
MDSSAKKTDEIMKKAAPVMITMYGICCLLWLIMTFTMVNRQVSSQVGMTDALVFS